MTNLNQIEQSLLNEMDVLIEKAQSQGEKAIYELFKTAVLKKYQDAFEVELSKGKVHKENVDKAFEFRLADACAAFRTLPDISDDEKESFLKEAKLQKTRLKKVVYDILANHNIEIVE